MWLRCFALAALLRAGVEAKGDDPELKMDALQIIHRWGYVGEEHAVVTKDEYRLNIFRIPYGKAGPGNGTRPVIFLQHGLECSCTNWLTNLPSESAAFLFADAGFDVWMGNFRGNTYSNRHLDPDIPADKYWDFCWDEMAAYDLPAMIEYALHTSRAEKLYLVGHSEGTMVPFALLSERPQWAEAHIEQFFALGPVATVQHIQGFLQFLAHNRRLIAGALDIFGIHDFTLPSWLAREFGDIVCGHKESDKIVCDNFYFLLFGVETGNLNSTRLPVYLGHNPAGTSTKNIIKFAQGVISSRFQKYDYGWVKNMLKYGSAHPPQYDLGKVSIPTYLFWGRQDLLADEKDIYQTIVPQVKTIKGNYALDYNHADFVFGLSARKEIYEPIINLIRNNK